MEALTRPAISGVGIVPFKSSGQLVEEEKQRTEARNRAMAPFISSLSGYIDECWTKAKEAKQPVQEQMIKNLNQRNGVYEATKLEAIREMGGSEVFCLLTETKCRALEAWIKDVLNTNEMDFFSVRPSPIADLPNDITDQIKGEIYAAAQSVATKAQQMGLVMRMPELKSELREFATTRRDQALEEIQEAAEKRAGRMKMKIADQLSEGGWSESFWQVISDFVTMKGCVIRGPVIRKKKVYRWVEKQGEGWVIDAVEDFVPEFDRVSPLDLYPAPDSRHPDDGYIIQRHRLARKELQRLIGVKGYNEENIRKVLRDYSTGYQMHEAFDSQRANIEYSGNTSAEQMGEKIEALEFWGAVPGHMLKEWGLDADLDPDLDYEVNAWKVGSYVIKAVLNPDKLGRKPYSVDSFERIPGSFWGKGLPEMMSDIQDICNAVARAIVNNASIASGPQVEVDIERVSSENEELFPWKIWQSDNDQMTGSPAVRFNQPTVITGQLMEVFQFFSTMAEDQTGVPRWAHGNADMSGAGATSSGLSMLMGHASRGVKEAIGHIDAIIASCVQRMYDYNMLYDEDDSIKGDSFVVARGSSSLVAKEQQLVRTREFLAATNNQTDMQIIGYEGRAELLRSVAEMLDLDTDEVVPDNDKLQQTIKKIEQQNAMAAQAQQMKGEVPDKKPQTLDPAGNPAGGVDANLFQNPKGETVGERTVPTT